MRRRRKALKAGDKKAAASALRVARYHRKKAQQYLHDRRARRKALRYKLKMKPKGGLVYFEGKQLAPWIGEICVKVRATGLWHGGVSSGYRSYASQWIIYYVRRIRPAARPGTSNHERKPPPPFQGAMDTNDPWGFRRGLQKLGITTLVGFKIPNDPWHFSHNGR